MLNLSVFVAIGFPSMVSFVIIRLFETHYMQVMQLIRVKSFPAFS